MLDASCITTRELALKLGVNEVAVWRFRGGRARENNQSKISSGILRLAFERGFLLEALSIIFGGTGVKVNSTLVASVIFSDLKPAEVAEIQKIEGMVGVSPLPVDQIKVIVNRMRANEEPRV